MLDETWLCDLCGNRTLLKPIAPNWIHFQAMGPGAVNLRVFNEAGEAAKAKSFSQLDFCGMECINQFLVRETKACTEKS